MQKMSLKVYMQMEVKKMVIKYKKYIGALIYAKQIKGSKFKFVISDAEDIKINFVANMQDIRIINCLGNTEILSEI